MPHHKNKRTYKNQKKTNKKKSKNRTKVKQSKVKQSKVKGSKAKNKTNKTKVKRSKINRKKQRTKVKKNKNVQKGGMPFDEAWVKKRVYAALNCDDVDQGKKSTAACTQNLMKEIFAGKEAGKNNELMEALLDNGPDTKKIHEYIQDLIRKILAGEKEIGGKEAGKNNKLMEALLDDDPDTITIQKYVTDLVKDILWSIFSSVLVGKDGIKKPETWDKNLKDKKIIEDIKKATGINEKDPNICLRHLLNAILYKIIPGTSTIDSLSNAFSSFMPSAPNTNNN